MYLVANALTQSYLPFHISNKVLLSVAFLFKVFSIPFLMNDKLRSEDK